MTDNTNDYKDDISEEYINFLENKSSYLDDEEWELVDSM
jgi:hypothetical protein